MTRSTAKYLFAAIGLAMVLGSLMVLNHTASFVHRASRAQGTVTALARQESTDYSNTNGSTSSTPSTRYTFQPIVRFQHGTQRIQFSDSVASNPPAYHVGEIVNVLYLESDPYSARIESFTSLWFVPIIFCGLGAILLTVGVRMIFSSRAGTAQG